MFLQQRLLRVNTNLLLPLTAIKIPSALCYLSFNLGLPVQWKPGRPPNVTDTLVRGQLYLRLPFQNPISIPIQTLYFHIPISRHSHKGP